MKPFSLSIKVEKKVPSTANMAHSFSLSMGEQECSVCYSDVRDRAIKAYIIPQSIDKYNNLSEKERKGIQKTARAEIMKRLGDTTTIMMKSGVFPRLHFFYKGPEKY